MASIETLRIQLEDRYTMEKELGRGGMGAVYLAPGSPFRQPIGERLYRMEWLGPIGRAFIRISGRSAWKRDLTPGRPRSGVTAQRVRPATPTVAKPVVAPDRIEALEQRVSDLERWRKDTR